MRQKKLLLIIALLCAMVQGAWAQYDRLFVYDDVWDDVTTTDNPTPTLPKGEGAYYDLSGRKLGGKPVQRGIYINNGKKVVIK